MNLDQLKTIVWLRVRLTRNQWAKSGGLGAALAVVLALFAVLASGASFVGGLLGGVMGLAEAKPQAVMLTWLILTAAFLLFWTVGLLTELQRSETIDLQRLMHLPVALGQMFIVNYVASHVTLSIVLVLPAMTGLALGLAIVRGPAWLLLLPLSWSMVFMITAWTYCLRGWLGALMSNPRRRRAVIVGITLVFVLGAQLPNLYLNVFRPTVSPQLVTPDATAEEAQSRRDTRRAARERKFDQLEQVQKFIPPFWVPVGASALAEHRSWPAMLGSLGCAAIGALGLMRAYRGTVRAYRGDTGGRATAVASAPKTTAVPVRVGRLFVEWRLPIFPEQSVALALGTFRSMLRAPEVKMTWAASFFVTVILSASIFVRAAPKIPDMAKPFVVLGTIAFSLFMLIQFMANQFGFDRDGFRALVLSPADRRHILLGKNLATWPVGAVFGVVLLTATAVWLRLPLLSAAAALFQLVALLLICSLGGNVLSILVPYRVAAGSTKPTKMTAKVMLLMVACQLLFPLVMLPAALPPAIEWLWILSGGPRAVPVNLFLSLLLAATAALLYRKSLDPLGALLRRREIDILKTVSAAVE